MNYGCSVFIHTLPYNSRKTRKALHPNPLKEMDWTFILKQQCSVGGRSLVDA